MRWRANSSYSEGAWASMACSCSATTASPGRCHCCCCRQRVRDSLEMWPCCQYCTLRRFVSTLLSRYSRLLWRSAASRSPVCLGHLCLFDCSCCSCDAVAAAAATAAAAAARCSQSAPPVDLYTSCIVESI